MSISNIEFEDPWDLLDTGTFIHYDNEKAFTIGLVEKDGTPIKSRLEFIKDNEIADPLIKFEIFNDHTILIKITHNGNLSNYGLIKPIQFGSYNGRLLFFNFRLDLNNNDDGILVHYSWYLGKGDKV